jgi:hypothetical protein
MCEMFNGFNFGMILISCSKEEAAITDLTRTSRATAAESERGCDWNWF